MVLYTYRHWIRQYVLMLLSLKIVQSLVYHNSRGIAIIEAKIQSRSVFVFDTDQGHLILR